LTINRKTQGAFPQDPQVATKGMKEMSFTKTSKLLGYRSLELYVVSLMSPKFLFVLY